MDALSGLLQEAREEYIKQKHARWRQINYACAAVVSILFVSPIIIGVRANNNVNIETIYSELYVEQNTVQTNQNAYYIDEFDVIGVI